MNEDTLVAVCCYGGDVHQVKHALPQYLHHECPVIVFSPKDSPGIVKGVKNHLVGRAAYIGQESLDRQRRHLEIMLTFKQNYFLLHDSDSFCVSALIPRALYGLPNVIWSNEVTEPRPHASPYPKLAFQPPYFLHRSGIEKILTVAERITAHPITPYIDWAMNAWSSEAGLSHRPFTDLEHSESYPRVPVTMETGPWQILEHRIKYYGSVMMHPIKTPEQVALCANARTFYEQQH
jgi:hypothetical protein